MIWLFLKGAANLPVVLKARPLDGWAFLILISGLGKIKTVVHIHSGLMTPQSHKAHLSASS